MLTNKFRFFYEWLRYFSILFPYIFNFPKMTFIDRKKVEFWTWITLPLSHSYVATDVMTST